MYLWCVPTSPVPLLPTLHAQEVALENKRFLRGTWWPEPQNPTNRAWNSGHLGAKTKVRAPGPNYHCLKKKVFGSEFLCKRNGLIAPSHPNHGSAAEVLTIRRLLPAISYFLPINLSKDGLLGQLIHSSTKLNTICQMCVHQVVLVSLVKLFLPSLFRNSVVFSSALVAGTLEFGVCLWTWLKCSIFWDVGGPNMLTPRRYFGIKMWESGPWCLIF